MPIGPYLDRMRHVCAKLRTDKITLGCDVNAWSVWCGSERNYARCVGLCHFLDVEGLYIINNKGNEGSTLTFEVYRGDRLFKYVMGTYCVQPCFTGWSGGVAGGPRFNVHGHNVVTFAVPVGGRSGPRRLSCTRVYNTVKGHRSEFGTAMGAALKKLVLTVEMVK
ncbi:hypothetical protein EVAR_56946_1 [Eumeta japonica]|uniref:Endonuclease/exonuclease/phosphatase domain-containing protein n=1 Tax=Eumeta variegata TaxID=151549 RepID=A0A4C1YPY9_EUMVA|nr:hypothetical protein EVAR_56946_1 [Eumeta japonica]